MENSKKITLATVKEFIKKNETALFVKKESSFDGMSDMVEFDKAAEFKAARKTENHIQCTLGIDGVWVVGGSRNWFKKFENENFIGIEINNCCGTSLIGIKK
jgi:hypothetical protein